MVRTVLLGVLAGVLLVGRPAPAVAQAPDAMLAMARFVGVMSVVVPACGVRNKAWGISLAFHFVDAVNASAPGFTNARPAPQLRHALDTLNQAQRDGRAALAVDRQAVCAGNGQPERLRLSDSLIEGTRRFW